MNTATAKADDHARANAAAWFQSIQEMVKALDDAQPHGVQPTIAYDRYEAAQQTIQESVLSVLVRDGWRMPGGACEDGAEEYEILLTTGGPACRIYGKLDQHGEPETAVLQTQDWYTPWADFYPEIEGPDGYRVARETLLAFARCFYFGE